MMETRRIGPNGAFVREFADVRRRVQSLETKPAGNQVIRETLTTVDPETGVKTVFGQLPDGSYGIQPFVYDITPPPVATVPVVFAEPGLISVAWDGLFVNDELAPRDFEGLNVIGHRIVDGVSTASSALGFIRVALNKIYISTDTILVGEIWQFSFESVDFNGNLSERSDRSAAVEMKSLATDVAVDAALQELQQAAQDLTDAAQEAQDAADQAQRDADTVATNLSSTSAAVTAAQLKADQAFNKAEDAARDAGLAQDAADGKTTNWTQPDQPAGTGHKIGDTWFDSDNNYLIKTWDGSQWVTAVDAYRAQQTADSKSLVYTQATVPPVEARLATTVWYDTSLGTNNVVQKYWAGAPTNAWTPLTDKAATDAKTVAESKGETIYSNTEPAAAKRLPQNTWVDTTGGINIHKRWSSADNNWIVAADSRIASTSLAVTAAQKTADDAAISAAAKSVVYTQATAPPVEARLPQTIWNDTSLGNDKVVQKYWAGAPTNAWTALADKAATDAAIAAGTAQTSADIAMAAQSYSTNASFDNWTGTYPVGFAAWSALPTKETSIVRRAPFAVRYNVPDAATQAGMAFSAPLSHAPNLEYFTVEMDVYLVSGTFAGAGVILDWNGMSNNRALINLATEVPTPTVGKWYRIVKTLKRPDIAAGTWTSMGGYLMGQWTGLGTGAAKDIIFDWFNIRPSSTEEILAYKAPADAQSKADTAQAAAIATAQQTTMLATAYSKNPSFDDWSGTLPDNYNTFGVIVPVKDVTNKRVGAHGMKFTVPGTEDAGIDFTGPLAHMPNLEYVTVEVEFMLISGSLSGAGVLIDWNGISQPNRALVTLSSLVTSPNLNKWYSISAVVKRPSTAGTWTSTKGWLMANWNELGAKTAKTIVYDWLNVRPSTSEEVLAYNAPADALLRKQEAITAAGQAADTKIATAKAEAIAAAMLGEKTPNKWLYSFLDGFVTSVPPSPADFAAPGVVRSLVSDGANLVMNVSETYRGSLRTMIRVDAAKTITFTALHDDAGAVYLDGNLIYTNNGFVANASVSFPVTAGWHMLELVWSENAGGDGWYNINPVIGSQVNELAAPSLATSAQWDTTVVQAIAAADATQKAQDAQDEAIRLAALDATAKVATKNATYRDPSKPTGGTYQEGDIWIDTDDGNKMYVHDGTDFSLTQDQTMFGINTAVANAISTSASGKNKVIYSTEPATGTNYIAGDTWFQRDAATNNIIAQWEFTTTWQARQLTNSVIANIDAGKIISGFIHADRYQGNSITVSKLAVTDFNNLFDNGRFDMGTNGMSGWTAGQAGVVVTDTSAPSGKALSIAGITGSWPGQNQIRDIPWAAAEEVRIKGLIKRSSTGTSNASIRTLFLDKNKQMLENAGAATTLTNADTWYPMASKTKAPANTAYLRLWVEYSGPTGSTAYFTSLEAYRMNAGELLVDGTIKANSAIIENGAIGNAQIANLNATKLDAGILSAERIGARSIGVEKLVVADMTNIWPNQYFDDTLIEAYPLGAAYIGAEIPPVGKARLLESRDHIAWNQTVNARYKDPFVLEATVKRTAGSSSLNAGLWVYKAPNVATPAPWLMTSSTLVESLTNGWERRRWTFSVESTTADYTQATIGYLYFQIDQPSSGGATKWLVSDVSLRRRGGGELLVDGAIDGKVITGPTIQTQKEVARGIKLTTGEFAGYDTTGVKNFSLTSAGSLTLKGDITSGSTITGATITGGLLQTEVTPSRGIKMTTTELAGFDSSGVKNFQLTSGGALSLKGSITTGSTITGATVTGSTIQTVADVDRGIKLTTSELSGYDTAGIKNFSLTTGGSLAIRGTINSGSVIVGATLQAGAGGIETNAALYQGIKIKDSGIHAYNPNGDLTFKLDAATGYLEVPGLKANSITGDKIATKTLTADNIALGGPTNVFDDAPFFSKNFNHWEFTPGGGALTNVVFTEDTLQFTKADTTVARIIGKAWKPVQPGDKLSVSVNTITGGTGQFELYTYLLNDAGVQTNALLVGGLSTVGNHPAEFTVPAGVVAMRPYLFLAGDVPVNTIFKISRPQVIRMVTGNLLVEGAINGKKITGATIQTDDTPINTSASRGIKLTPTEFMGYDGVGNKNFSLTTAGDLTILGKIKAGSEIQGAKITGTTGVQTHDSATAGVKMTNTGIKAWDGSNNLTFHLDATTGYLELPGLKANSIKGTMIEAGAVSADKVLVSGSNIHTDPGFRDSAGWQLDTGVTISATGGRTGGGTLNVSASATQIGAYYGIGTPAKRTPVKSKGFYRVSVWIRSTVSVPVGGASIYFRVYNPDNAMAWATPMAQTNTAIVAANTWTELSATFEIPAGYTQGVVGLYKEPSFTTGILSFSDLFMQQASSGELIVDGSIVTTHMKTGTIDGAVISANTLKGAQIIGKSITADKLVITSTDNLVVEADFENAGTSWQLGANNTINATAGRGSLPAMRFTGTVSQVTSLNLVNKVPVGSEDRFRGSLWVKSTAALTADKVQLRLRCYTTASAYTDITVVTNSVAPITSNIISANTWTNLSGISPVLPANTVAIEFYLAVTNNATGTITDIDYVGMTRAADGALVVDGTVTANKLETELVLASKIIAGNATGTHAEMSPAGFKVFAADPAGGAATEVVRLGVASTDDYFAVTKADGKLAATISQDGKIVSNQMHADVGLYYKGEEMTTILDRRPTGIIGWAQRTTASTANANNSQRFPYLRLKVNVKAGRAYKVSTSPIQTNTGDTATAVTLRLVYAMGADALPFDNTLTVVTTSAEGSSSSWQSPVILSGMVYATTTTTLSVMIAFGASGPSVAAVQASTSNPAAIYIEDLGQQVPQTGEYMDGTAPAPTPVQNFYKEYSLTGASSYKGDNTYYAYAENKMFQGDSPAGVGNTKSIATFQSMTTDLSGATITDMRVYLYFEAWYFNAGGTARIGLHGHSTPPGTFSHSVSDAMISADWPKPGGRWVGIPSTYWDGFKSGAYKGISLSAPGGYAYYGYASENAIMSVSYTK
jgi:hypothetical protein